MLWTEIPADKSQGVLRQLAYRRATEILQHIDRSRLRPTEEDDEQADDSGDQAENSAEQQV